MMRGKKKSGAKKEGKKREEQRKGKEKASGQNLEGPGPLSAAARGSNVIISDVCLGPLGLTSECAQEI